MVDNCLMCDIYENDLEPRIYENEHFYAIFDVFPVTPGHALVIPKRHVVSRFDLTDEEAVSLEDTIRNTVSVIENTNLSDLYSSMLEIERLQKARPYIESALESTFINQKPEGYNIGNNEGRVAGRTIDHLHIQVIPRYAGDVAVPTGGIRNIIPEKGNYRS